MFSVGFGDVKYLLTLYCRFMSEHFNPFSANNNSWNYLCINIISLLKECIISIGVNFCNLCCLPVLQNTDEQRTARILIRRRVMCQWNWIHAVRIWPTKCDLRGVGNFLFELCSQQLLINCLTHSTPSKYIRLTYVSRSNLYGLIDNV